MLVITFTSGLISFLDISNGVVQLWKYVTFYFSSSRQKCDMWSPDLLIHSRGAVKRLLTSVNSTLKGGHQSRS